MAPEERQPPDLRPPSEPGPSSRPGTGRHLRMGRVGCRLLRGLQAGSARRGQAPRWRPMHTQACSCHSVAPSTWSPFSCLRGSAASSPATHPSPLKCPSPSGLVHTELHTRSHSHTQNRSDLGPENPSLANDPRLQKPLLPAPLLLAHRLEMNQSGMDVGTLQEGQSANTRVQ